MTPYRKIKGEVLTLVQSLLLLVGTHQLKQQRALRAAIGTRSLAFERMMLGVVAVFVVGLMSAAYLRPPVETTRLPMSAMFIQPAGDTQAAPFAVPTPAAEDTNVVGRILANLPLPGSKPTPEAVTATVLSDTFSDLGYDFKAVLTGEARVPRLLLARLPGDISDIREVEAKKSLFLQSMLPLVLQVNEEILANRRRALDVQAALQAGEQIPATDRLWLAVTTGEYGLKRTDIKGLIHRLDTVPVSLALAQAASESGWGTSRFVREGNALFGEWTFSDETAGIAPDERDDGETHRVRAFTTLLDSVRAYARNLNTHRAYREFRSLRARLRQSQAPLDGSVLAGTLKRYSERGEVYIGELRSIIKYNDLQELDGVKFSNEKPLI